MTILLKCPACREKFKYDVTDGWPDACPICHTNISNKRDDDDVVVPNILSFKTKNNDKVARDIMNGSETRAELAAGMAGVPVSEMSGLKITDLNDRNDAQFSTPDVVNPVTQRMAEMQARGLPTGFGTNAADAMGRAAQAHTGAEPYAGARARNRIQNALRPIGQAPLPREIADNPNYRSRV
jgi:hypothetical protein